MTKIWTSLKKYKKVFLFLSIIFVTGIIAGFLYYNKVDTTIVANLQIDLANIEFSSNIIYHVTFLAIIIFFSFFVIGSIFGLFLYFYEALSIGFIMAAFFSSFGLSGFFYSVIYVILFKGVYVLFLVLILIKSFKISRNIVGYFLLKKDSTLKDLAITNFMAIIKLCFGVLLYDVFLVLLGNNILGIFNFLI